MVGGGGLLIMLSLSMDTGMTENHAPCHPTLTVTTSPWLERKRQTNRKVAPESLGCGAQEEL